MTLVELTTRGSENMHSSGGGRHRFCKMRRLLSSTVICMIVLFILTISTQRSSSSSLSPSPISSSRHLQDVDGVTACSDCRGKGLQCVGRTIDDTNCQACATGQTFWPCNLPKECWCWDTSGPRDPGDEMDGTIACGGCGRDSTTEICVGNQNSLTPVTDEECNKCMEGQSFWPCTDQDLCWCWDTTKPKKPPAPISGYPVNEDVDPCGFFTEELFDLFAPNSTFPYTYDGLCDAIIDYNKHHTEKIFGMGSDDLIRMEIAAFLGNTAHESDDYEAGREYLACGDRKEVDGKVYCKPCTNDLYDWINNECSVSMVDQNAPYNSYCQPSFEPPEGCVCDTITQVEETGPLAGYVEASKVFYGRGAIQLSWNYNYIRASYALTGEADTFCNDPEQVATNPMYAWGTAIFFWMESQKEGTTCHKEALNKDFGGTLNVINGGLECPAYKGGWHHDAIKMRINRYCHAAVLLGLEKLSSFNGCKGLTDSFEECLGDGWCPYCEQYANIPTEESGSSIGENTGNDSTEADNDTVEEVDSTDAETPGREDIGIDPYINTDEEGKTPDTGTSSNPKPSAPTQSASKPAITDSPTVLFSKTKVPTKVPSAKDPTSPSILDTDSPTLKPSLSPATNEPSASPLTNSPTEAEPTYMPTTPEPTLGPCGGLPCPDGLCRSAWGFCGDGEGYCNDSAIWAPTCPTVTAPPSLSPTIMDIPAAPTNLPIGTSTLNDVFGTSNMTDAEEDLPPPTPEPTNLPTGSKTSSGPKPPGGKKPVGGKPSPTVKSPPPTHEPTTSPTPLPTDLATLAPTQQPTEEPTVVSNDESTSLSYPENTYFCGNNWQHVNELCSIRCPSSKSEDCPGGMSCFAFTTCNDNLAKDDATDSSDGSGGATTSDSLQPTLQQTTPPVSSDLTQEASTAEGCTGAPCPLENECRSEFGFCGTSFIYCNDLSSWTLENCGLLGVDATGETHLCDVELFECSNGKAVYRNPAEMCEYFQCPEDEEGSAVFPSMFNVPGPSPLPPLPKPTLPTITKPTSQTSSAFLPFGETSSGTGDESTPASSNNLAILLGNKDEDEVVDDTDQVEEDVSDESVNEATKPVSPSYDFGTFKAEEWFKSSSSSHNTHDLTSQLLISLAAVLLFIIH